MSFAMYILGVKGPTAQRPAVEGSLVATGKVERMQCICRYSQRRDSLLHSSGGAYQSWISVHALHVLFPTYPTSRATTPINRSRFKSVTGLLRIYYPAHTITSHFPGIEIWQTGTVLWHIAML